MTGLSRQDLCGSWRLAIEACPRSLCRAIIVQCCSASIIVEAGLAQAKPHRLSPFMRVELWKTLFLVISNACEPLILFVWPVWLLHQWDKNTIVLVPCTACPDEVRFWLAL